MDFDEKKQRLQEIAELIKLFPDNLQEKVFSYLLTDQVDFTIADEPREAIQDEEVIAKPVKKGSLSANKKNGHKLSVQIVKDLNLKPTGTKTLIDFVTEKQPKSNVQKTTVFVYYMQKILNISSITIDHIYTCYKELGVKVSENLDQNLRDCSSSKFGYIDYKSGTCSMTVRGDNLVEHDLSPKTNAK